MRNIISCVSLAICIIFLFQTTAVAAEEIIFYHTDAVGTPVAMSNMQGERIWEADYKPFGEEYTVNVSTENDKRFVGKVKDEETGLNYFGARYLSAGTGRFLAPDSVRAVDPFSGGINPLALADPQRQNVYGYSLNNPNRYVDPDGNFAILIPILEYGVPALIAALSIKAVDDTRKALDNRASKLSSSSTPGTPDPDDDSSFKKPKTVRSAKGVNGRFTHKGYSYRIDTNNVSTGEGRFHIHVMRNGREVAKINGRGAYAEMHGGKQLSSPSQLPKSVTKEIRTLVRHVNKNI